MENKTTPKIKNTIGYKLLKAVFSLYVIIALIITGLHMYSEYVNAKDIVLEDMKNIEKIFLKQMTTTIWNFDTALLEDIISGILVSRSITGVSVQSKEKEVLGNFGAVDNESKITKNSLFSNEIKVNYQKSSYSYTFILQSEEYNNNEVLSYITLYSNDKVIYSKVKNNFILIIINSLIKTFALWVIFLFFANRYLTKPFFEIIEVTNNIDSKKLDNIELEYSKKEKSEFDILKKTFNDMFFRLKKSYKELNVTNKKNIDLNKNLETKVESRTSALKESNSELEKTILNLNKTKDKLVESEKLASLGSLVSGVAHEINTPIGIGITSATHLIRLTNKITKDYKSDAMTEDDFISYLDASNNLGNLINNNLQKTANLIQSFKKISIEKLDEEKILLNLNSYLSNIVLVLSSRLSSKNITVQIHCDKDLEAFIYKESLNQVMYNLILNSIKHGYKDSNSGEISIYIEKEKEQLRLIYIDDGKGISAENLPKIFNPFFTTSRNEGGTGLGLNIVHNIITKIFKGTITSNSKAQEGVNFTITIPLDLEKV